MLTKFALLVAVHAHPVAVVTPTLPLPPAAGTSWLVAEIEYTQGDVILIRYASAPPALSSPGSSPSVLPTT
jgi:hypothetical protein